MNDPRSIELYVTLASGARVHAKLTTQESRDADFFDEDSFVERQPDYVEVIEAANLIAAGQGERYVERRAQ